MKKWLVLLLVFCLLFGMTAQAVTVPQMGEQLTPIIQADFPDWQFIDDSVYSTGQGIGQPYANHYTAALLQWQEDALLVREASIIMNDYFTGGVLSADSIPWEITDYPPIPVTPEARARLSPLAPRELFGSSFYNLGLQCDDLTGCAEFLLNEGEVLTELLTYPGTLVGVVEDGAGHAALRVADWDGTAYTKVTSTAMMDGQVWFDNYHSSGDYLIFSCEELEAVAVPGQSGEWRIAFIRGNGERAEDWFSYDFSPNGLYDNNVEAGNQSNAAFLYGRLNIPTVLEGLDLSALLPEDGDFTSLLDDAGYACVKHEGASLFDAPDGYFVASCFQRLPGVVIAEEGDWVQLQIGSEAAGMQGWFRREDLAFGAEVNEVWCSFPSYDLTDKVADTSLEELFPGILAHLGWTREYEPDPYTVNFWLIGAKRNGDFLVLVDGTAVVSLPLSAFTSIGPTYLPW